MMVKFITIVISTPFYIAAMFYSGFVLSMGWGWFIVPLGVPEIGVLHAMGIIYVGTWFKYNGPYHKAMSDDEFIEHMVTKLIGSVIFVTLVWGLMYVIHLLMA